MTKESNLRVVGPAYAAVLPDHGIPWYKQSHLRRLNFCIFSLFLFASANGYDGSMMNGLQALPQWQKSLRHPKGDWLGFVNAAQSLGAFLCYPLVAWSNNRFGRKKSVAMAYFWLILGVTMQSAAQDPTAFVLGRLFLGGASAFWGASVPLLMTETAYPTHRATVTALYNTGWYVGSLIAAWTTFGTRDIASTWAWRIPSIVQFAVPLVALPGFLLAPESPRWLIAQGRHEEAKAMLIKYHGGGDAQSPLADFEYREIEETLRHEVEIAKTSNMMDMFKGKGNRHRAFISITLGIFAQWNGVGIVSYYLPPVLKSVGITSVTNQTMISGFISLWNLILAVSAAFAVDRVGRRPLFLASSIGMLSCYVFITAFSATFAIDKNLHIGIAVIPFLFLYYGFYDIAFTPLLPAYTCEIWTYTYRARGLALMGLTTQLAVFFNVFVNGIALDAIAWKYYLVYIGILCVITGVVFFCYPETRGRSLEEIAVVFDGPDAAVPSFGEGKDMDGTHYEVASETFPDKKS